MADGIFNAKAIKGSEQWGPSAGGYVQLRLMLGLEGQGAWPTDLIFSPESAHFSQDRLRAMGWDGTYWPEGHEWAGFPNLSSIFGLDPPKTSKVFKARIRTEMYQGALQTKCEVYTGAAPIEEYKPETRKAAAGSLQAMLKAPRPERKPRSPGGSSDGMPDDEYYR